MLDGKVIDKSITETEFVKADKNYLYDSFGKRYLDLRSGLWNTSLGYSDEIYFSVSKEFSRLMNKKLAYLDIHSFDCKLYDELSTNIISFVRNNMKKCIFTNSGSENTELALKIASAIYGKKLNVLAINNSYHGSFFGGMSVSGIDIDVNGRMGKAYEKVKFIDFPDDIISEESMLTWLEINLEQYDLFFIEPVLASAGVRIVSDNFVNEVLRLCKEKNTLTVFDEVATGFYRTGKPLFADRLKYKPDIICLSKGINNGISPFGSVCVSEGVLVRLEGKPIYHYSTQNGNLLSVSSANSVIKYYLKNGSLLEEKVGKIETQVKKVMKLYPNIVYRCVGAMLAIEVEKQDIMRLNTILKDLGILTYFYNQPTNGLTILPQFNINLDVLEKALRIILNKIS